MSGIVDRQQNVRSYSALADLDCIQSTLLQFWAVHKTRLNHCLALRHFEQRFKELQGVFIVLHHELDQLPDLTATCLLADSHYREDLEQLSAQLDDLSQRAQVITPSDVILARIEFYSRISRR